MDCEDNGRPRLDGNMNFIWEGLEESKYTKKLPAKVKEVAKTDEAEIVDIIGTFEFSDDGTMDLFAFDDYTEPQKFTTLFDEPIVQEAATMSCSA